MRTERIFFLALFSVFSLTILLVMNSCGGGGSSSHSNSTDNFATLSWDPPTINADGTPLTDLAGYKVHYGTSSRNYTAVIDVGNVITYKVKGLKPGTYFFVVTAYYNTLRNESGYSNEVSKTIQ